MQTADILPFHFDTMTLLGMWCPADWSPFRKYLRKLHLMLVVTVMYGLVMCQLARLLFVKLTFQQFNDTFYIMFATCGSCFKLFWNIHNRDKVLKLIGMFQESCCLPRDDYERNLRQKYDDACRKIGKALLLFVEVNVVLLVMVPLVGGYESRRLPYKLMQFYSLSLPLVYWLTYACHVLAAILLSAVNIITDATITGFMTQLCGQLDLVAYRLGNLPKEARQSSTEREAEILEKHLLKENIKHHVHIYKIAKAIVAPFNSVIVAQFYVSVLQICVIIYQLTTRVTNVFELTLYSFFLVRMLLTLYALCYFGNELSLKSVNFSDAIFDVDWTSLSAVTRKSLMFMILRSSKPIETSDGAFVHLTMETFGYVVKTSYSAFSVLKTSK